MFSLVALFYGDYPAIADKLLRSINTFEHISDVRLGLNAVSSATEALITDWAKTVSRTVPVSVYVPTHNVGKYPLMRQMFHDPGQPLADWVMWFDDDSYLEVRESWWEKLRLQLGTCTQLGALHRIRQRGLQYMQISKQPWYAGKEVTSSSFLKFATGGWWVAKSGFLRQWDYPFKAIHHNGGDSILGELLRQRDGQLVHWGDGLQCHCESCLPHRLPASPHGRVHINVGGRKGRRGLGVTGEKYVWNDGKEATALASFQLTIRRYG